jgi:hypothetical protein
VLWVSKNNYYTVYSRFSEDLPSIISEFVPGRQVTHGIGWLECPRA